MGTISEIMTQQRTAYFTNTIFHIYLTEISSQPTFTYFLKSELPIPCICELLLENQQSDISYHCTLSSNKEHKIFYEKHFFLHQILCKYSQVEYSRTQRRVEDGPNGIGHFARLTIVLAKEAVVVVSSRLLLQPPSHSHTHMIKTESFCCCFPPFAQGQPRVYNKM